MDYEWYFNKLFAPIIILLGILGNGAIITILHVSGHCLPNRNILCLKQRQFNTARHISNPKLFSSSKMNLYLWTLAVSDLGYLVISIIYIITESHRTETFHKELVWCANTFKGKLDSKIIDCRKKATVRAILS